MLGKRRAYAQAFEIFKRREVSKRDDSRSVSEGKIKKINN